MTVYIGYTIMNPLVAPSFYALIFLKILMTITIAMVDCTPFINDYIKKESRATASAICAVVMGIC